ncbi:uncharacterized protein METZ01_LOCUS378450, partial [marine metagenome]
MLDFGPISIIISGDLAMINSLEILGYLAIVSGRTFSPPAIDSSSFRKVSRPTAYKSRLGSLVSLNSIN